MKFGSRNLASCGQRVGNKGYVFSVCECVLCWMLKFFAPLNRLGFNDLGVGSPAGDNFVGKIIEKFSNQQRGSNVIGGFRIASR